MIQLLPAIGALVGVATATPMATDALSAVTGGRTPSWNKLFSDGSRGELHLDAPEGERFVRVGKDGNIIEKGPLTTERANYFGGWGAIDRKVRERQARSSTNEMKGELKGLNDRKLGQTDRSLNIQAQNADTTRMTAAGQLDLNRGELAESTAERVAADNLRRDELKLQMEQFGSTHTLNTVAALSALDNQAFQRSEAAYQKDMDRWAVAERANRDSYERSNDSRDAKIAALRNLGSGLLLAFN